MRRTNHTLAPSLFIALLLAPAGLAAQSDDGYRVRDLAPGVFSAVAPEGVSSSMFASSLVVVGESGVLVVDSGQRPGQARALLALIRARTDRPVRWVVNTHAHWDHVWGNAVFRDSCPGVRILGTPATRDTLATNARRDVVSQIERHRRARATLAAMRDTADAALREEIDAADSVRVERIAELEGLEVVLPGATFEGRTTLDLGGRTAVLVPLGPAHTASDAVVWLPDERIVAVGDLLEDGELWLERADIDGWLRALDAIEGLDPRVAVPGHGSVSRDGTLLEATRRQLVAAKRR